MRGLQMAGNSMVVLRFSIGVQGAAAPRFYPFGERVHFGEGALESQRVACDFMDVFAGWW